MRGRYRRRVLRPTQRMAALPQQDVPHGPGSEPTIPSDLPVSWGLSSQDALLGYTSYRDAFAPERFGRALQSGLPLRGLLLKPCQGRSGGSSSAAVATFSPWPPLAQLAGGTPLTLQFFVPAPCFCPRPEPSKENKLSSQCLCTAARRGAARCLSPPFCFSLKKHKILTFTKSCLLKSKGG